MKSFQFRIREVKNRADLTIADLRTWFGRPYATVWRWVESGWVPRGPAGRKAEQDLERLENALIAGSLFPVPPHVSGRLRQAYVRNCYHAAERARLPSSRTAR